MRRDLLGGTVVASLVRPLSVLRVVVVLGLLGLVPGGVCVCSMSVGKGLICQVLCVVRTVRLRVGAEQGPASSPWCDVGCILASIVTSEKLHDGLSFRERRGVSAAIRRISNSSL